MLATLPQSSLIQMKLGIHEGDCPIPHNRKVVPLFKNLQQGLMELNRVERNSNACERSRLPLCDAFNELAPL